MYLGRVVIQGIQMHRNIKENNRVSLCLKLIHHGAENVNLKIIHFNIREKAKVQHLG